jgi:hypothetical protein
MTLDQFYLVFRRLHRASTLSRSSHTTVASSSFSALRSARPPALSQPTGSGNARLQINLKDFNQISPYFSQIRSHPLLGLKHTCAMASRYVRRSTRLLPPSPVPLPSSLHPPSPTHRALILLSSPWLSRSSRVTNLSLITSLPCRASRFGPSSLSHRDARSSLFDNYKGDRQRPSQSQSPARGVGYGYSGANGYTGNGAVGGGLGGSSSGSGADGVGGFRPATPNSR